jgi:3-hydroxyisobutyrate dehydrogenase-like beta-hydroxyacid dehydrogenase
MNEMGFIGLGSMGLAMAKNLAQDATILRVWNRTASKAEALAGEGVRRARCPAQVAEAGIVVSMVADDRALEEIVGGPEGVLAASRPGLHISMSTVSPAAARTIAARHAERGWGYVAAPVFGRPDAAAARKLWICASGSRRGEARPVLYRLGQGVFDFGDDPGAANVVKLSGNFLIAAALEAMAEAFTLAEKNGIGREAVAELFGSTLFSCPIYRNYGEAIARKRYRPAGFRLALGWKDVTLALGTARESGVPMPLASLLHDRLLASIGRGRSDLDWTALAESVSEEAGLPS